MKQSFINFDEKFIPLIREGKKTFTSRLIKFKIDSNDIIPSLEKELISKCAWDIGQIVEVTANNKSTLIKIQIENISVQYVSQITKDQAIHEGFQSKEEYINEIARIYGENIRMNDSLVWIIQFYVISNT